MMQHKKSGQISEFVSTGKFIVLKTFDWSIIQT